MVRKKPLRRRPEKDAGAGAEELESSTWLEDVAIEVEVSEDGFKVRVPEAGLELRSAECLFTTPSLGIQEAYDEILHNGGRLRVKGNLEVLKDGREKIIAIWAYSMKPT
jgi:hypothetical protein